MSRTTLSYRRLLGTCTLLIAFGVTVHSANDQAAAYTVESPEVKQLITKGLGYLEGSTESRPGGKCLIAMAFIKGAHIDVHPKIKEAEDACRELAKECGSRGVGTNIYDESIACIFMCELDPERFRGEIQTILTALVRRQQPNGSWNYEVLPNPSDTSQTQYGVLAMWACHNTGFTVPVGAVEKAVGWLVRTQDSGGGFAYNPREGSQRQSNVTHSMSAAGLGSVYVCAHLLGMGASQGNAENGEKSSLPPALQLASQKKKKKKVIGPLKPANTNVGVVKSAFNRGNAWFDKNFRIDPEKWTYYYMYGLERYQSFRELIEGKSEAEPDWYNKGVDYLKKEQGDKGSWYHSHESGTAVDTAFAVLFLTRSTKASIKKATVDEGVTRGGIGLPDNTTNIQLDSDGKVVTPQMVKDVDELLAMLDGAEDMDFDPTKLPGGLTLDEDLTKRDNQLLKLREMVTDERFERRLAAVKTLARARELDNVPALIYALSDPNPLVVREARDGLRFISRKFTGYGLDVPSDSKLPDGRKIRDAVNKWQRWYVSIRPDGELIE